MKTLLIIILCFSASNLIAQQSRSTKVSNSNYPKNQAVYKDTFPVVLLDSNISKWENFLQYPEEGQLKYNSIYYNPKAKKYYYATISKTNEIQYAINPTKTESLFTPSLKENYFTYIGNLSPIKRVYLNPNHNTLYVKTLSPIKDDTYIDNGERTYPNTLPVFPVLNSIFQVVYTNRSGQEFRRILSEKGVLILIR